MTNIKINKKHPFLFYSDEVREIFKSLKRKFNLSLFIYGKYYRDGRAILLSDNPEWMTHHLASGYSTPAPIPKLLLRQASSIYFIPNEGKFCAAKQDLLQRFQSDQGFDFIFNHGDTYEVICFSFMPNCAGITTVLNHIEIFKNFIDYFKNAAASLIKQGENHCIQMPIKMRGIRFYPNSNLKTHLAVKVDSLGSLNAMYGLSKRQSECIALFSRGKTCKQISRILDLSPRTIEHYYEMIKTKIGVESKSELLEVIMNWSEK